MTIWSTPQQSLRLEGGGTWHILNPFTNTHTHTQREREREQMHVRNFVLHVDDCCSQLNCTGEQKQNDDITAWVCHNATMLGLHRDRLSRDCHRGTDFASFPSFRIGVYL
mmetsp:Transcript_40287/g.78400  ORF Transcript_40287/g.78400 Transcript_40287/m.78400 type:complete len:110 (+) Transcript_40287:96-425(+)